MDFDRQQMVGIQKESVNYLRILLLSINTQPKIAHTLYKEMINKIFCRAHDCQNVLTAFEN